jgi:hypothetical protein
MIIGDPVPTPIASYFWPDMPLQYGAGRVIDYDGARYFRNEESRKV